MAERKGIGKLLVGLDFGTTHTGIAFAFTRDDEVLHVEEWPGQNGQMITAQKNPTLIAYIPNIKAIPWGYQIEAQNNICAWMKYHLDKNGPITTYDDPKLTDAIQNGLLSINSGERKDPETVATDYLKEVFKFTVDYLSRLLSKRIVKDTPIEWWLLRPAIWSPQAVLRLELIVKKAALEADFYRDRDVFNFVTEADAAACSALFEAATEEELNEGDVVMVCDCGGGTVDITVYETPKTLPLKMGEVVAGLVTGGKCGSASIDLEFDSFMHERFGEAYERVDPALKKLRSAFMRKFQNIKHRFGDTDDQSGADELKMELPLSMEGLNENIPEQFYHRRDKLVRLTRSDMERIFQPTVDRVLSLIKEQYRQARKKRGGQAAQRDNYRLILAGGFSRSKYLQAKIGEWCDGVGVSLKALDQIDSWGAIAYGAVLRQLQTIEVSRRLSRFHSGIPCDLPYNADLDRHSGKSLSTCRFTGQVYTNDCVYWYSHRDDVVSEHSKKTGSFSTELGGGEIGFDMEIVACGMAKAPRHFSKETVFNVGTLKIVLSSLDLQKYQARTMDGRQAIRFQYMIEETVGSMQGSLVYRAIDARDRTPIGEAHVVLPKLE